MLCLWPYGDVSLKTESQSTLIKVVNTQAMSGRSSQRHTVSPGALVDEATATMMP